MEQPTCTGNHRMQVKAVGDYGGSSYCRRHLNRHLQDDRTAEFIRTGPRCPDHPDATPLVTRWYGTAPSALPHT